jgi:N-acetylmuramoyl-L-alanine amidase
MKHLSKVFWVSLAIAAAGFDTASATNILEVRYWSAPEHTRIVIDLSEPAEYRHHTFSDPPRIAVDVNGGRFRLSQEPIPIGDGLVQQVRFNELRQSGKAQIVLDLDVETRYDLFALEKYELKLDRIVIDVKRPLELRVQPEPPRRLEQHVGPDQFGDFLVMIDPGHGGEDPGRRNSGRVKEKNLALSFSKTLAEEINRRRGYRAELTRTGDYFVSLGRRRQIAEQRGAHLFVSIHFNAAPARSANGTEVYFVSLKGATNRATRELVRVENSADLVGGLPPHDEETSDALAKMLVDLRQNDSVERSQRLATLITDRVKELHGIQSRKVRQAAFADLKSLFIPAVLVEVAFLTNPNDLRYVQSKRNRKRYVQALADGIIGYCEEVEIPRLGWKIHTVHRGETLSEIALAYEMDLTALRGANGIDGDRIRVGQKLRVRPR